MNKGVGFLMVVAFLVAISLQSVLAFDVGRSGRTYEIAERDMLKLIRERMKEVPQERIKQRFQKKLKKGVKNYRPPSAVSGLKTAQKRDMYTVDMTIKLDHAIKDMSGNVIYPKGYTFNPLKMMAEKGVSYPYVLVVINGERKPEIDWFKKNFSDSAKAKLLIADGQAIELGRKLGRPVYYLTKSVKQRFAVEKTPSVIFQPKGKTVMAVSVFKVEDYGNDGSVAGGNGTTRQAQNATRPPQGRAVDTGNATPEVKSGPGFSGFSGTEAGNKKQNATKKDEDLGNNTKDLDEYEFDSIEF